MSLDWNVSKVANMESVCFLHDAEGKRTGINPITETLIFLTMIVDMGDFTTATEAQMFFARVNLYERLFGAMRYQAAEEGPDTPLFITYADVEAHRGLRTNVSKKSQTVWLKRMWKNHEDAIRGGIKCAAERAQAEKGVAA